eukprot:363611-Chlamydomonas_euryale.AAC.4
MQALDKAPANGLARLSAARKARPSSSSRSHQPKFRLEHGSTCSCPPTHPHTQNVQSRRSRERQSRLVALSGTCGTSATRLASPGDPKENAGPKHRQGHHAWPCRHMHQRIGQRT